MRRATKKEEDVRNVKRVMSMDGASRKDPREAQVGTRVIRTGRAFRRRPRGIAMLQRPPGTLALALAAAAVAVAPRLVVVVFFGHPARRGFGLEAAAVTAVVVMRRLDIAALGGGGTRRPFHLPRKGGWRRHKMRVSTDF
jgi:hypothetical protein